MKNKCLYITFRIDNGESHCFQATTEKVGEKFRAIVSTNTETFRETETWMEENFALFRGIIMVQKLQDEILK